jgi:transketolase
VRADNLFLEHIAYNMRRSILLETTTAGSGHPTSALSAADIVAALFLHTMHIDLAHPENPDNDRFILSKGHASPVLYAVYKELGVISEDELLTYRQFSSVLEGHPTPRFRWSEAATGSLGQGLSIGVGMALAARIDNREFKTYVLMGDSELSEGSVWEATELAAYYKLHNLIGIIDCNRLGQTGETMHGYHTERYAKKFEAFGWKTFIIDGHDMQEVVSALDKAQEVRDCPTIIIAKTIKGYGVEEAENKNGFHGKVFKKDELPQLLNQLEQRFSSAVHYHVEQLRQPLLPQEISNVSVPKNCTDVQMKEPTYELGKQEMTRKAFGQALASLGGKCKEVVVLDAEVKNSTYTDLFEAKYPERFVESFIAEQCMIGMAVGLQKRGKIPFCATFGAFFTRAFDQIRMAAIGNNTLRLVGSHAGVSIGEDGPSQMALEDIAMMRTVFGSIVLYPADAVSAWKLTNQMLLYNQGISYLRTTRAELPVIYQPTDEFVIGGCKVLMQSEDDKACVIGAGVTLHEAIKAYHELLKEGISISVIDLYSIKPLDTKTILNVARRSSDRIITVEDHYLEGGLGQAVVCALANSDVTISCLAVEKMPRSGKPEQLLNYEKINAQAIIAQVKNNL